MLLFQFGLPKDFKSAFILLCTAPNNRNTTQLHRRIRSSPVLPTMARLIAAVLLASFALTAFAAQAEDIRVLNNRKMLWGGANGE